MTSIAIKGIRVESINVERTAEGAHKVTSTYSLISSADRVLAKQSVGGYSSADMKIEPSATTVKALDAFVAAYRADVQMVLGLDAE